MGERGPVEVAIVAGVALVHVGATSLAAVHQPERRDIGLVGLLLLVAAVAVVPLRHRYPRAALAAASATTLLYLSLGYPRGPVFLPMILALAATVLSGHRRTALASVA